MSEERPTITSSRLTATEVARHNFGTVRRGFDPQEVRAYLELVARDMQTWEQREQDLRQEVAELAERVRHPVLDEATLTAGLGQQSALLLRNAHEEAARVTADAEERAAALVREAQSLAAESSVRAEASAAERIAEAELAVGGVREQGQAEAQAIVDAARADAQATVEAARADAEEMAARAREHGRHLVEEAQAARKRVLADLAQRRHGLHVQIEQLRAAREQLTTSVLGVRDLVEGIADDLAHADDRARVAAADAGRRAGMDAALGADEILSDGTGTDLGAEAVAFVEELGAAGEGATGAGSGPAAPGPAPDASAVSGPAAARGGAPEPATPGSGPPVGATEGVEAVAAGAAASEAAGEAPATAVVDAVPTEPAVPEPSGAAGGAGGKEAEQSSEAEDGGSIDSRSLEELFARIRASQHAAASGEPGPGGAGTAAAPAGGRPATPAGQEAGGEGPDGEGPGGSAGTRAVAETGGAAASGQGAVAGSGGAGGQEPDGEGPEGGGPDEGDRALLERRDEVLQPTTVGLSRRLKRALADDQNGLLDRLRANGGVWADDVLPAEDDHAAALAAAAMEPLQEAVAAGQALAAELGTSTRRRARQVPVEGLAEELGLTVVRLLRRRLPGGEDGPAAADVDDASDAVGAAYRTWRGQRVESLVGDYTLAALGAGVVAAGAGRRALRWVVGGDGTACADCDDNSLAGAVPAGDEFPTGHAHPPAHAGCRCLVVPAPA